MVSSSLRLEISGLGSKGSIYVSGVHEIFTFKCWISKIYTCRFMASLLVQPVINQKDDLSVLEFPCFLYEVHDLILILNLKLLYKINIYWDFISCNTSDVFNTLFKLIVFLNIVQGLIWVFILACRNKGNWPN